MSLRSPLRPGLAGAAERSGRVSPTLIGRRAKLRPRSDLSRTSCRYQSFGRCNRFCGLWWSLRSYCCDQDHCCGDDTYASNLLGFCWRPDILAPLVRALTRAIPGSVAPRRGSGCSDAEGPDREGMSDENFGGECRSAGRLNQAKLASRLQRERLCDAGSEDGHVISWQRRDVNLPPDPILKLMAVASCCSLYIISSSTQRISATTATRSCPPNVWRSKAALHIVHPASAYGFQPMEISRRAVA